MRFGWNAAGRADRCLPLPLIQAALNGKRPLPMSRLEQSAMRHDKISDKSEFDRAFDAAFSVLAFVVNRHLIHHMLRATRTLGVDYETLIVWGVLAHQNVAHLMLPGHLGI